LSLIDRKNWQAVSIYIYIHMTYFCVWYMHVCMYNSIINCFDLVESLKHFTKHQNEHSFQVYIEFECPQTDHIASHKANFIKLKNWNMFLYY
jgi:hypothetical protein